MENIAQLTQKVAVLEARHEELKTRGFHIEARNVAAQLRQARHNLEFACNLAALDTGEEASNA